MELVERRERVEIDKKLIKDTIHGYIELHPVLLAFIDTPQFQRLRYIKQLGGVCYVYPTATHTRFEHALGSCHLAGEVIENFQRKQPGLDIRDEEVLCVKVAALCHDLGHGPFSNTFQDFVMPEMGRKGWKCSDWSVKMLDELLEKNEYVKEECERYGLKMDGPDRVLVKDMICGCWSGPIPEGRAFLLEIVRNLRNGIDVCKMDYITRDGHSMELSTNLEWRRYIKYARVIDGHICTRTKVAGNLIDMLDQRWLLFRKAYYHKTVRMIEYKISCALLEASGHVKLLNSNGELMTLKEVISGEHMDAYTRLTDSILHQIMATPEATEARETIEIVEQRRQLPSSYTFIGCAVQLTPEQLTKEQLDPHETADVQVVNGIRDRLSDMLMEELKKEKGSTTAQSVWTDVVVYDYCLGNKNPFLCEMFYTKEEPNVPIPLSQEQLPRQMPVNFREIELRVYSIGQQQQQISVEEKQQLEELFVKWCQDNNFEVKRLR